MKSPQIFGQTARINVSSGAISIEDTSISDIKYFLGGRGINILELIRNIPNPKEVDPFSPDNPLIIGVGLLCGTAAPNAARFNVTAKSPETYILGDANGGGFFAPAMKRAGFDRLIIKGKSETPIYILLEEGNVIIKDATDLWGLDTQQTQIKIREIEGEDVHTICIGPAGERLVRFACIITGKKNSASRGGMGAVMGSKQIKAIVARDNAKLAIHDPDAFLNAVIELKDYLNGSKIVQTLRRLGTPLLYEPSHILGTIRTHNSQQTQFKSSLFAKEFHKLSKGAMACASCVVHCRHAHAKGGEGPEYSTVGILGSNCGIADAEQVIELNDICNNLGLDTSSTGGVIAWFIEMHEKGYLPPEMDDEIEYGNFELMKKLLSDIAYRNGIGTYIAESTQILQKFDKETAEKAKKIQIAVKGLPQSDPHDCRYIKGFALGIGTASRGADHLRSRPTIELFDLPDELIKDIYGKLVDTNPTSYKDKGWIVAMHESIYAVGDALGICRFVTHSFNSPHLIKYEHFDKLVSTACGLKISDYRAIGDRIVNLERLFNLRCGITRQDDYPPYRYMTEPSTAGVSKGHLIDKDGYNQMLDDYYTTRGWSLDGIPNPQQIEELEALIQEMKP